MGLEQWEKERDRYCLACSPIDAPETAVLIAIRSINIDQYDSSYFLVPHVPSSLGPLAEHICTAYHIEVILPSSLVENIRCGSNDRW